MRAKPTDGRFIAPRTSVPAALHVEMSRDYIWSSTGGLDAAYEEAFRHGRRILRRAKVTKVGNDLAFLAYLLWSRLSLEWQDRGDLDDACLIVGALTDEVTDDEAALLCEFEPELRGRVPSEGVGSMTPEVSALFDLLSEVASVLEDGWQEARDDADGDEA